VSDSRRTFTAFRLSGFATALLELEAYLFPFGGAWSGSRILIRHREWTECKAGRQQEAVLAHILLIPLHVRSYMKLKRESS
jgi:hypothetical protein